MRRFALGLLALGAFLAAPFAAAAKDDAGVTYIQTAPSALRTDAAYLLLRTSTAKSGMFPIQHVLLRIPTEQELEVYRDAKRAAYAEALPKLIERAKGGKPPTLDEFQFDFQGRANTFVVESGKFIEDGEMRTIVMQVPAGIYILYGITMGGGGLVTCNCLGTVSFNVRPGVITDIGSLYADKVHKPSPVPHLEDNLGPQMFQYGLIFGEALVPAEVTTPVPASLHGLAVEPARFEVVGQYYEPGAGSINRLAPIPGILGYEHGRPVDLRTGKVAQ